MHPSGLAEPDRNLSKSGAHNAPDNVNVATTKSVKQIRGRVLMPKMKSEDLLGSAMVQTVMIFGIGVLSAALLALAFMPVVHERAVRLTAAQLDEAIPASVQELRVEKDQMRSQVAVSLRRLEVVIEHLKKVNVAHQTEITKKTERLSALQAESSAKAENINALEENVRRLQNELSAAITDRDINAGLLLTAQQSFAERETEYGRLTALVADQRRRLAERDSVVDEMQGRLEKSESLIAILQRDLSLARERELSAADLHEKIDQLEARIRGMAMEFTD